MNKRGVSSRSPYIIVGVLVWIGLLKSGVHVTLAGVLLLLFILIKDADNPNYRL